MPDADHCASPLNSTHLLPTMYTAQPQQLPRQGTSEVLICCEHKLLKRHALPVAVGHHTCLLILAHPTLEKVGFSLFMQQQHTHTAGRAAVAAQSFSMCVCVSEATPTRTAAVQHTHAQQQSARSWGQTAPPTQTVQGSCLRCGKAPWGSARHDIPTPAG